MSFERERERVGGLPQVCHIYSSNCHGGDGCTPASFASMGLNNPSAEKLQGVKHMNRSMAAMGVLLSVVLSAADGSTPAGLWLEAAQGDERDPALLMATDVHMEVTGLLVETRVTQHFLNTTDQFAEGRYVFPLPDDTAVETLDIIIGERHIAGEIRERGQARQQYRQARDSGRAAGLVERELGNLFVTRVANIPPGERVEIRIGYRQRVDYAHGRFRLRFPTTVVPRFGHSLAAAHAMSDVDGRHPDDHSNDHLNANANTFRSSPFQLSVDLAPGMPLAGIESSHHDIRTEQVNGRWHVDLRDEVVDSQRDFELEWTPADTGAVEATAFAEQYLGKEHLLLMLTPPQSFEAVDTPREVIVIIDTSGSMQGEPMDQARESLIFALASLGSEDRFNVIEFNHRTRALHEAPVIATRANLLAAKRWVERLNAGGGTVMGPSLAMAMSDAVPAGFLRQIVFVTDGLIANEREVLDQIEADIGDSRLFTVGIGHGVNSAFLRQASAIWVAAPIR
jgi:Ca-activated chloride channel homolog